MLLYSANAILKLSACHGVSPCIFFFTLWCIKWSALNFLCCLLNHMWLLGHVRLITVLPIPWSAVVEDYRDRDGDRDRDCKRYLSATATDRDLDLRSTRG